MGPPQRGGLEPQGLQVGDVTYEMLPAGRHVLPGVREREGSGIEALPGQPGDKGARVGGSAKDGGELWEGAVGHSGRAEAALSY